MTVKLHLKISLCGKNNEDIIKTTITDSKEIMDLLNAIDSDLYIDESLDVRQDARSSFSIYNDMVNVGVWNMDIKYIYHKDKFVPDTGRYNFYRSVFSKIIEKISGQL